MKVLLDTDIGSDIDDAACLAYLLAQPQCELLGITTVTGEGRRRGMLASALCREAGQDVPIYIGAEQPFLIEQRQPTSPQADALGDWSHATDFPRGAAIEFMRSTIRANPGEVWLLPIGPLTNVALLFAADPEIPSLLGGLMLMGGSYWSGVRDFEEWNAILDPHATAMVYRAPLRPHRSVGLDVTTQVRLSPDEVRRRFGKGLLRPVMDFAEVWFTERAEMTLHDPLAAVCLFDEAVCGFTSGQVSVDLGASPGKTSWQESDDGPHEVATSVDVDRFFEHYFGTLGV
ncbi:MAG: nucleoside hydrolase [Anaerolineaceae bacterium]|nr:nucleoside hydrolase [Anaerolineaceae bacterium]